MRVGGLRHLYGILLIISLFIISGSCSARVVAVVVGVNDYDDDQIRDLAAAVNDAKSVADVLRRKVNVRDDDLQLLTSGATEPALLPTLTNIAEAFTRAKANLGPEDVLLFYFAGHGGISLPESGSCLLPQDTDPATPERRAASVISAPLLTEWLAHKTCRAQVIITDCCRTRFDDAIRRGTDPETPEDVQRAADRFAVVMAAAEQQSGKAPDRAVIYACSIGESAIESKSKGRGIFTSYLLEGLEGKASKAGKIVVSELFSYTARMMKSAQMQTPDCQVQGTAGDLVLAVIAPPPGQDTAEGYLQQGKDLIASGDRDGAILALSASIRLQPDSAEAYRLRAACRYANGQHSLALNDAQAAVELEPRNAANYALRGNIRHALKDNDEAVTDLSRAIQLTPEPVASYFHDLGTVFQETSEYARAVEQHNRAIQVSPTADYYCSLTESLRKLDRDAEAIQAADRAVELAPAGVGALQCRGDAYASAGKYEQALADYDKALALSPKSALLINQRAHVSYYRGDYEEAIRGYTTAIELEPNDADYRAVRANAYLAKRDLPRALADCDEALRLDPANAFAWRVRGQVHVAMKTPDLAIVDFTKAIELAPKDAYNYGARAQCYFERKNWDAALMDRCRQVELAPDKAWPYSKRAWVYARKEEWDLSIKDFTRAIELDPKDHNALAGRGDAYFEKGDNQKALSDLNAAISLSPMSRGTAWYYYSRGRVYVAIDKRTEARADFHKVMGLEPDGEHAEAARLQLELLRLKENDQ